MLRRFDCGTRDRQLASTSESGASARIAEDRAFASTLAKERCKYCGGSSICEHCRIRSRCTEGGGTASRAPEAIEQVKAKAGERASGRTIASGAGARIAGRLVAG
jgi:hypothetical protein